MGWLSKRAARGPRELAGPVLVMVVISAGFRRFVAPVSRFGPVAEPRTGPAQSLGVLRSGEDGAAASSPRGPADLRFTTKRSTSVRLVVQRSQAVTTDATSASLRRSLDVRARPARPNAQRLCHGHAERRRPQRRSFGSKAVIGQPKAVKSSKADGKLSRQVSK